ncbi:Plasmodium exported protein, unknown function [Plasmodium vivax]|uniref:Fam-l protein n=1 Tax=Plasmodium vivax TaxID=5855 RepID=A0A565A4N6_PLAVI|nr:Plasmodium exported protein, unknown function [Plasmodium vivax]
MILLKNSNFKNIIKCFVIFKIFAFIILIWIYETDKYACIFRNFIEQFNVNRTLNRNFNRSLGVYEKNYKYHANGEIVSDNRKNKNITNNMNDKATYEYLKKGKLSELESYNKNYKKRYSKKKGLAKLECYCEKKIFDKICYIDNVTNKRKNQREPFLRKVLHKFAICFIIISLISIFGSIINILFGGEHGKTLITWCDGTTNSGCNPTKCKEDYKIMSGNLIKQLDYWNQVISCIGISIFFIFIIYIFIKIIKYEKIKAGIRKMNAKGFFLFLKDLL